MSGDAAVSIRSLRVDYGDFTAVENLNLELAPGEIFGLAGPNGAGKTSTIKVLATLQEPTYGEVELFGHDLFDRPDAVRSMLGYMPDLAPTVPDLRVWEFLDLYAASYGLRGQARRSRVDECLEKVGLADKRNVFGKALSRGMTQRVVLAKTLLHSPKVLLLDEPASGMDPLARRDMRLILEALSADGAAIIVSSHILSELAEMCTSVGIMHQGQLLRHGPLAQVLGGAADGLVRVQLKVLSDTQEAVAFLGQREDVSALDAAQAHISFVVGDQEAAAQLLHDMVVAGIRVGAFTPQASGIESVLMEVIAQVSGDE